MCYYLTPVSPFHMEGLSCYFVFVLIWHQGFVDWYTT